MGQGSPVAQNNTSTNSTIASNWLTELEVLDHFKICKRTLWVWYSRKGLPKYQLGRLTFYKRDDLDQLIQKNKKIAGRRKLNKKSIIKKHPTHGKQPKRK